MDSYDDEPVRFLQTEGQRKLPREDHPQDGDECGPSFSDIMEGINSELAGEKMSKAAKASIFHDLNLLIEIHDEVKLKNAALQAENNLLRELHQKSTSTSNSRTYAAAVTAGPKSPTVTARLNKSVEQRKHHVFVTSKEGKPSKEVQRIFTQSLHPTQDKLKIRGMRSTDTTLIIETETESDADRIINHPSLRNKSVIMEKTRKRKPLVILYDMPSDAPEEQLIAQIYHQNFEESMPLEDFKKECRLRFRAGPRNRSTVHMVFEMTARLRKDTITKGRLYVGFASHTAKDYVVVPRCHKCQDLGHIARHCRKENEVCSHCGEQDHKKDDCERRQQPATCIPCTNRKKSCPGKRDCPTQKLMWDRQIAKIDYG